MTRAQIDRLPAHRYGRAHVIRTDDPRRRPTARIPGFVTTRDWLREAYRMSPGSRALSCTEAVP